jgi:hypothetical protein
MSNPLTATLTKFIGYDEDGNEQISFGFRIYDDYQHQYGNLMTEEEFNQIKNGNGIDLLVFMLENYPNDPVSEMIEATLSVEKGMTLNGNYYDYEAVKEIFNDLML